MGIIFGCSIYRQLSKKFDLTLQNFNFEDQSIDAQMLTIRASDLRSHNIELTIPFTASLGLDTHVHINSLQIEKNFCELNGATETTWWRFDEGDGVIVYDSAGSNTID